MPRYVHLKTVDVQFVAAPAGTPPTVAVAAAKSDVVPEFVGADSDGNFTFNVPAYSTVTSNHLQAVHVSLFEKTVAVPVPAIPADPAAIVAAALHYRAPTAPLAPPAAAAAVPAASVLAQTVVVDATAAPEGSYSAALVAEFDA
jgi:hypothetical protein